MFQSIELIIKHREKAGVSSKNNYIFGMPSKSCLQLHLRACDLMRKIAFESGIKNHHLIRGVPTRGVPKQLATQSAVMDLKETEHLANFIGHDDKIHKDYYRLPVASRENGRVSTF